MKVNTAKLKTNLGKYLQMVRKGKIVEVTSHSYPVAKIVPYGGGDETRVIGPTRPVRDLKSIESVKTRKQADGVRILLEDRGKR